MKKSGQLNYNISSNARNYAKKHPNNAAGFFRPAKELPEKRQPTRPYAGDTPPGSSAPPRTCRKHASRQDLTPGIRRRVLPPRQGTAGTRQPSRPYAGDTPPGSSAPPRNCRNTPADKTLRRGYAAGFFRPAKELPEYARKYPETPELESAPPRIYRNTPENDRIRQEIGVFTP
jgi:hypothetical protein